MLSNRKFRDLDVLGLEVMVGMKVVIVVSE